MIPESDLEEVKSQYEELMKQSREQFPDIAEFMLHTACIDWLNKQFDSDYETDLLSVDMSKLE
jgi:hypothetical protein